MLHVREGSKEKAGRKGRLEERFRDTPPPKSPPGGSEKGKILEPQSFRMQEEQDNSIIEIKT